MYFDDLTVQDLGSMKGSAQQFLRPNYLDASAFCFLNTGSFGKLGRAGLNSLCHMLADELLQSFALIRSLLDLRPERELPLLLLTPDEARLAYVVDIDTSLLDLWSDHPTKIVPLELLTVSMYTMLRSHQGLWFVDNIAALMSLVRGGTNDVAGATHGAALCLTQWLLC